MSDAVTPNYGWAYPTVGADEATWGGVANAAFIAIDASLKTVDDGLAARLAAAANLGDLANVATAKTNLELGTAADADASRGGLALAAVLNYTGGNLAQYVSSGGADGTIGDSGVSVGALLLTSGNLAGLANKAIARGNLDLGSMATHNVTISSSAPSGGSDGDIWLQYT